MQLLLPRQLAPGSCPAGKTFYRCFRGSYSGCCSTNPCDTGVCADEGDNDSSTSGSSLPTLPSDTGSETLASSSQSIPTSSGPASSSTPQPDDGARPPAGPIIGGVAGGAFLLALLAALLWYLSRRKFKISLSVKSKKSKEEEEKEKNVQDEEARLAEREKLLAAARQQGVESATIKNEEGTGTGSGPGSSSSYPLNSTAFPPPRWN